MIRLRFLLLAALLALPAGTAAPAGAVDTLDRGPKVGTRIPHTLEARDQNGQHRDFRSLARERGLIVLFSRSLSW